MALSFRGATRTDLPGLRDAFGSEPSEEQVGLAGGDVARARRLRALMAGLLFSPAALLRTTVAIDDGQVAGFLQSGSEAGPSLSVVFGVMRIFRFGTLAFARRDRTRSNVHLAPPAGSYHIAEIHVLSARRNRGIGEALLAEAERDARSREFAAMSLTTTTSNPARHLYERFGFELVETREDAAYLAMTGIAGRVLMVKQLR